MAAQIVEVDGDWVDLDAIAHITKAGHVQFKWNQFIYKSIVPESVPNLVQQWAEWKSFSFQKGSK